jgi:hypothetical protein
MSSMGGMEENDRMVHALVVLPQGCTRVAVKSRPNPPRLITEKRRPRKSDIPHIQKLHRQENVPNPRPEVGSIAML